MNTLYYYHLGKFIATRSSIISHNYKDFFFFLKYIIHLNDYYLPKKKKKLITINIIKCEHLAIEWALIR